MSATNHPPPLIAHSEGSDPATGIARHHLLAAIVIVVVTVAVFSPTLENGFLVLGFDDAIILDTPALRGLSGEHIHQLAIEFNQAHYIPLTLLSLAVDHSIWGMDPRGFHLSNAILHAVAAVLVFAFAAAILPVWAALVVALGFALHPVQMEAVSLVIQRKTILSGALFFLTLVLYQQWRSGGRRSYYVAALLAFAAAALAKPAVMTLPLVLCLYEIVFIGGRVRLGEKVPFLAVSAGTGLAAVAAHAAAGATHGPHGGNVLVHGLMVVRAGWESVLSLILPVNLAPVYYYPKDTGYSPLNFMAAAAMGVVLVWLVVERRRYPWVFFCAGWIVLVLLPEANLIPLAQLRADRFLYLAVVGAAIGLAVSLERLDARTGRLPGLKQAAAIFVLAPLALLSYRSAPVWRSDVAAWERAVERHPWSVTARTMLGRAYLAEHRVGDAERILLESIRVNPTVADPYAELARLYLDHGARDRAAAAIHRLAELVPDHPELARLRHDLQQHAPS